MTHSVIIGGTKGLGKVVASQFMARGDNVSVIGRTEMPLGALVDSNVRFYKADINNQEDVATTLNTLVEDGGNVNYCVFLQRYRGKEDDWMGELQTTLTATKNIVEQLIPRFSAEGDNGIVMVSSVFSKYIVESQPMSYHVAKAGLEQMMRYYALHLGPKGIRVNSVMPFTFLKEESKSYYLSNQPLLDLYESIIPLNRMATAEDSANVIDFLCGVKASFLSGQSIVVDGGLSLHWPEALARRLKQL